MYVIAKVTLGGDVYQVAAHVGRSYRSQSAFCYDVEEPHFSAPNCPLWASSLAFPEQLPSGWSVIAEAALVDAYERALDDDSYRSMPDVYDPDELGAPEEDICF